MAQWTSLPPLLTHWTKLQFDRLMRTLLHFHRRAIRFLRLQEVGVAPDAIFHILPGIIAVQIRGLTADRSGRFRRG